MSDSKISINKKEKILFDREMADKKTGNVVANYVLIGKPKENEELFCDCYYHTLAGLYSYNSKSDSGYIINSQCVNTKMINTITIFCNIILLHKTFPDY